MLKDIVPEELKEICSEWYDYHSHKSSFDKLESRPNSELDMNVFTRCIVGKSRQGVIYFDQKKYPETYCKDCFLYSRTINKLFHMMIRDKMVMSFSSEVKAFINHFKKSHSGIS